MGKVFIVLVFLSANLLFASSFTENEIKFIETAGIGTAAGHAADAYITKMSRNDKVKKCQWWLKDNKIIQDFHKDYNEALEIASNACADELQRINR